MGARFCSNTKDSSNVTESLPPDKPTATRSPALIIRKRPIASPTFRRTVFSNSTFYKDNGTQPPCVYTAPALDEESGQTPFRGH